MIKFYELENNIQILRVRTDNAPEFRISVFEECGKFHELLTDHGIKHEFIRCNTPQENSTIERRHKTIDDELLPHIKHLTNKQNIVDAIESWGRNSNIFRKRTYGVHNIYTTPYLFLKDSYWNR